MAAGREDTSADKRRVLTQEGSMRAIVLTAFGSAEHFRLAEPPRPEPQPGEVRIRIHAVAFNPSDYQRRQGSTTAGPPPIILGSDVAGVVDAIGAGVTTFAVGDEVYPK